MDTPPMELSHNPLPIFFPRHWFTVNAVDHHAVIHKYKNYQSLAQGDRYAHVL